VADNGSTTRYTYDDAGRLAIERGPGGEKAFVNQWYTVLNGEIAWKDVFAGTDRIATQKAMPDGQLEDKRYFLHKDLQGSTNVITDPNGLVFEHLEYFPGGETWVLEHSDIHRTPYLYAGGYLDEVRGLINLGQRWYDPREEFLYSPDPVLAQDPRAAIDDPSLLPAYTFAESNPVRLTDPDGRAPTSVRDRLRSDFAKFDAARKINAALTSGGSDQRVSDRSTFSPLWRFASSDGGKRWTAMSKALDSAPLVKLEFTQTESGWGLSKVTVSPLLISAASKEFAVGAPKPGAAASSPASSPTEEPASVGPSGGSGPEPPTTVRVRPRAASAPSALGSSAHGGGAAPEPLPESP
jgi:RHS repeat-associated protein